MYLLGYDIGTSSIKATLMDAGSQQVLASATAPKKEMDIIAQKPGWAEQNPIDWWTNVKNATAEILSGTSIDTSAIQAIGITYVLPNVVFEIAGCCIPYFDGVVRPDCCEDVTFR